MLTRRFTASLILLLAMCIPSYSADKEDPVLRAWSHETSSQTKEGDQSIRLRATYYSNEYIEAL
ncbi:MAG: hypothetical protein II877_01210, partial [Synergistaceae bacterium]|nr:hypothetical protein [Synergistaceae bacterium]